MAALAVRSLPPSLQAALVVSVGLHVVFVAWLRPGAVFPARPFAVEHLEVSLAAAPSTRVTHRAVAARSNTTARKAAPVESPVGADRDEPLVEAKFDVATLRNPKPPYPLAARRQGIEGRVLLSARVRTDGACAEVRLKQSSGHGLLDQSAFDTVRRWRFLPAKRGNAIVDSWVEIPISFRLEG